MHLAYPASLQALHSNTYKQIIQIQHNRIKKPNWQEATSWLFYMRGRGFELGTAENKSSKWPERDSNPGPPDCESDAKTTRHAACPSYQLNVTADEVRVIRTKYRKLIGLIPWMLILDLRTEIWKINYSVKRSQIFQYCSFRLLMKTVRYSRKQQY